jgi:hypothetical protein
VAALLFKLDFAWQNGLTNKSCTSRLAEWTKPGQPSLNAKMLKDMEWLKPRHNKAHKPVNTAARRLFQHVRGASATSTVESLMDSLYTSCENAAGIQYMCDNTSQTYEPATDFIVSLTLDIKTS